MKIVNEYMKSLFAKTEYFLLQKMIYYCYHVLCFILLAVFFVIF